MKWHAEDNMNDRRKEDVPVPFDRRNRSDRIILWAIDAFLKKAIAAHQISNKEGGQHV